MNPAKTPVLQDKRFWLSVCTALSILLANVFGIDLSAETLAAIVTVIVSTIGASAAKEASVTKALVNPQTPPSQK